jgi:hypothetical protein
MSIINYFIDFDYQEPIPKVEKVIKWVKRDNKLLYIRKQYKKGSFLSKINLIAAKASFSSVIYLVTSLLFFIIVLLSNLYLSPLAQVLYSLLSVLIASLIILFWEILYFYTDIKIQSIDYKKVMLRYLEREKIVLSIENINREIQHFENTKNQLKRKSNPFLDLSRLYCENFITIFGSSLLISGFFAALLKFEFNNMLEINPFGTLFICSLPLSLKYLGEVKNPVNLCYKAIQALEEIKNNILT